jgi:hypothetical protein
MLAFTALISEKMESLSARGPRWQVSTVSSRQAGGVLPPLLARIWMNGDGRRINVDIMATLIFRRAICYSISTPIP